MHEREPGNPHPEGFSAALTFDLFSPFVAEDNARVDPRLLQALGVPTGVQYSASFHRKPDDDSETVFDFHLASPDGRRIFFDVRRGDNDFETCENNEVNRRMLEQHYLPHLVEHVDTSWLLPETFAQHYELLRKLSYLGRYPASGFVFVFPKGSRRLAESESAIKRIVSKSLAPRVAILYFEYLVARILTLTEDDLAVREHFELFKAKYVAALPESGVSGAKT